MRRIVAISATTLAIALAASSLMLVPSTAGSVKPADATFVIPASEGYGVAECLNAGGDCGRVVADGWCAANGYSHAASFGPTSSAEKREPTALPVRYDGSLSITCAG